MGVGRDLAGRNVWRECGLNRETKIDAVALADVDGAKAAGAESDLGGGVGGHCAQSTLSSCWRFMSILQHPWNVHAEWRTMMQPQNQTSMAETP